MGPGSLDGHPKRARPLGHHPNPPGTTRKGHASDDAHRTTPPRIRQPFKRRAADGMKLTQHYTVVTFKLDTTFHIDGRPCVSCEFKPVRHPMTGVTIQPTTVRVTFRQNTDIEGPQIDGDTVMLEGRVLTRTGRMRVDHREDSVPYHSGNMAIWPKQVRDVYDRARKVVVASRGH